MNRTKFLLALGVSILALTPSLAYAQAQTVVNAGDLGGGNNNGITFDSNPDSTSGEYFEIRDNNDVVFHATGDGTTTMSNLDHVVINYDGDGGGVGSFSLQNNGSNVLTANTSGGITVVNAMTTNGIDNGGDGITNAGAISGVTTLNTTGNTVLGDAGTDSTTINGSLSVSNGASITGGLNNNAGGITNAGAVAGVTTLNTSGLATLNSASVTTTLAVGGNTTLGDAGTDSTTVNGSLSTTGLATLNSASVTTTLGVTGATTLSGATAVNNTFSVDTNGGTAGGTRLTMDGTAAVITSTDSASTVSVNNSGIALARNTNSVNVGVTQTGTIGSDSFDYGTRINGGLYVDGDMGVNGSIYALNPTASSGINVGNNGLDIEGSTNTTTLTADSDATAGNGRGQITLEEDQASFLVYNATTGNAHGLSVNQNQTVVSGGTTSTSLILTDEGATFRNDSTGGPARVMGVADGVNATDAVNVRQLRGIEKTANAGIASVAAMANIPAPAAGKNFALGMGYGYFEGENAGSLGGTAVVADGVTLRASAARSNDNNTFGVGAGFSW